MTALDNSEDTNVLISPAFIAAEGAGLDFLLGLLINIASSKDGVSIGITLQTSGMLVSGILTGGKQYFREFAKIFPAGFADTTSQTSIETELASLGEVYNDNTNKIMDGPQSQFVHLKDARFFSGSGAPIPGNSGVLWRCKISSVGGFFLGTLDVSQN
jgi:hypothetical protein